jgi:hypothetical protein
MKLYMYIHSLQIWKTSKSTSKTSAHILSWNLNHLENCPWTHSKHSNSSPFNPLQDPILNHMWKSAYGRYGHYVDFGLMGPLGCCIIYLLNYAWRSRRQKWTKKQCETRYVKNSSPISLYLCEVKGCEIEWFIVFCCIMQDDDLFLTTF